MTSYSDAQLTAAVANSHSWRGVLRSLGLASASSIRSVRRHAERLGLDSSHFTGQRRWSDTELATAVAASRSWTQVADALGLADGSSNSTVRGHAVRLGLDLTHLASTPPNPCTQPDQPQLANLRRAGSFMAAAWFELCGHAVSWPLEPCRYDLLVWKEAAAERVQVKTTTCRGGSSWIANIRSSGDARTPYDPDDIDQFFVVDGDLNYYLIPVAVVAGLTSIQVSTYNAYRLPNGLAGTVESKPCPS